ncbi:MAG TPA: tetratricopeptide repeat protein [Agriterribacter sp.]|nr:tetratricopeptide repeat protein [Agriterribacter sp.]
MKYILSHILLLLHATGFSQEINRLIGEGNEAYRLQQYDKAVASYKAALESDPANAIASFNMGNALFKNKKYEEAAKIFDEATRKTSDPKLQSQLFYNKGVALTQQRKLEESIAAYKQSLRMNATDSLARENLQRAIDELQQQQQQNQQKEKKENPQPKPKQNKLNQQQVQQLLKALEEQERKLQDKMMKKSPTPGQPDKDW